MWGILILVLVVLGAGGYLAYTQYFQQPDIHLTGYLGGEKEGLLLNPEFQKILKDQYGLTLDHRIEGSFDMVQGSTEGQDYLFPSSQLALELFEQLGNQPVDDELIFNTPIVLYSRKPVVEALEKAGVVSFREEVALVDMEALAEMIMSDTRWNDLGLDALIGEVAVHTTDPNKSNSGNMFMGLLANALNGNQVVNMSNVDQIIPEFQQLYQSLGSMKDSSSKLFNEFLQLGMGANPIIAGYESQLLEYSKIAPDNYDKIKDDVVILYPIPTVWSSHIYIALNDQATAAIDALTSEAVQDLAWRMHGYRTFDSGTADPGEFDVPGLMHNVDSIMSMPNMDTMTTLMQSIQ